MPRAVIVDQLSGREVMAGPEEVDATQPLITYLVQKLGWHPQQLLAHPQVEGAEATVRSQKLRLSGRSRNF